MSIELIAVLFLIGILAGILSGLFGIGGGVIIVPSLLTLYNFVKFDSPYIMHIAVATSLFTIIFTALSSSHKHYKSGNVDIITAAVIGVSSSISVIFFTKIAVLTADNLLKLIFSAILFAIALYMFLGKDTSVDSNKNVKETHPKKIYAVIVGILSGVIAAFSGLGGGIFIIPLIHYLLNYSIRQSIGISSFSVFITAIAGVIGYYINSPKIDFSYGYNLGLVDVLAALPIIAGSIPAARFGVYLHNKTNNTVLKKLFAVFISLVAILMIIVK